MKKAAAILLLLIYSLTSFGVSYKKFYCCGTLKSISISLPGEDKAAYGKDKINDDCCQKKYPVVKVGDLHFTSAYYTLSLKHFTSQPPFTTNYRTLYIHQPDKIINGIHAPPLNGGVPVFISICVFRI